MDKKEQKYQITCSEEQMMMIANAVEDWSRFLSGQCELWNASSLLTNGIEVRDNLNKCVTPHVVPELPFGASYGWSGRNCENEHQRKAIAMSYGIYRQILHFMALKNNLDSVYASPTLTCPEQGELITIKQIE